MKLYTEEQVLNSMLSMKTYIEKYDESVIDSIVEKHLKSLGGIELPSDEGIKKIMTNNKPREINSPLIKQLIDETADEGEKRNIRNL